MKWNEWLNAWVVPQSGHTTTQTAWTQRLGVSENRFIGIHAMISVKLQIFKMFSNAHIHIDYINCILA